MDMYRELILDHYKNPRGKGLKENVVHQAEEYNQVCGDQVVVQLDVNSGLVAAMRFDGHGCAISQAAASLLTEFLVGKSRPQVARLGLADMENLLGTSLTPTRAKCALLALSAAKTALTISSHAQA